MCNLNGQEATKGDFGNCWQQRCNSTHDNNWPKTDDTHIFQQIEVLLIDSDYA